MDYLNYDGTPYFKPLEDADYINDTLIEYMFNIITLLGSAYYINSTRRRNFSVEGLPKWIIYVGISLFIHGNVNFDELSILKTIIPWKSIHSTICTSDYFGEHLGSQKNKIFEGIINSEVHWKNLYIYQLFLLPRHGLFSRITIISWFLTNWNLLNYGSIVYQTCFEFLEIGFINEAKKPYYDIIIQQLQTINKIINIEAPWLSTILLEYYDKNNCFRINAQQYNSLFNLTETRISINNEYIMNVLAIGVKTDQMVASRFIIGNIIMIMFRENSFNSKRVKKKFIMEAWSNYYSPHNFMGSQIIDEINCRDKDLTWKELLRLLEK